MLIAPTGVLSGTYPGHIRRNNRGVAERVATSWPPSEARSTSEQAEHPSVKLDAVTLDFRQHSGLF